ncbi:unnamed protein product [Sphagnum balticum]
MTCAPLVLIVRQYFRAHARAVASRPLVFALVPMLVVGVLTAALVRHCFGVERLFDANSSTAIEICTTLADKAGRIGWRLLCAVAGDGVTCAQHALVALFNTSDPMANMHNLLGYPLQPLAGGRQPIDNSLLFGGVRTKVCVRSKCVYRVARASAQAGDNGQMQSARALRLVFRYVSTLTRHYRTCGIWHSTD